MLDRLEGVDQGGSADPPGDGPPADDSPLAATRRHLEPGGVAAAAPFWQLRAGRVVGERHDRSSRSAEGSRQQAGIAGRESDDGAGAGALAGANPVVRQFRGTLAGDGLRHVEFEGQLDVHSLACSVRGRADGVEISPELRDSLPEPLAAKFAPLGDLRGQVELGFQFDYDRAAGVPWRFDVAGKLARGRIDDRRLPQALSDIAATFRLNNGGYAVEELTARSGLATLRLSCSGSGFDAGSPLTLAAEVRHLELDPALMCVLPPAVQERWRHYSPAGPIDADVRLDYDGKKWQPQISLTCLDVAFTHYKFPYRLDHGRGSVVLKDDLLKVELTAYSGRQPVRLTAAVTGPFSAAPLGWFEARGADLQIDEALFAALPEKSQEVARSLDPRGNVSFYMRMWRNQPEEPLHQHLVLDFSGGSACFNGFPYLLTNVRGTLEMLDHNWVFRNLSGVHNTAHVTCEGHLMPGLQGRELVLNFVGHDVALEEELRNALSVRNPHMQQVWLDIRPRGVVDLTAEVRCLVEEKKFNIGVRVGYSARRPRSSRPIFPIGSTAFRAI